VRSSRITQVTVTSNPADWKQDLTLLPEASLVENIAGQIASMGIAGLTALAGFVGILLSPLFIVSIKDRPRTWNDWGWACLTGVALIGTVIASGLVYLWWRRRSEEASLASLFYSLKPFSGLGIVVFIFALPVWWFWVICYQCKRCCWAFLIFTLSHLAIVSLVCSGIVQWLTP
jgi:hypothetical protein